MYKDIEIFIPTKGRLKNQKTYKILTELNLKPTLVIEPQEVEEAKKLNYNFLELPKNNQGISYSRNYILDFSRKNKYEYICIIDDDISKFGFIENKKRIPNNVAFLKALEYFKQAKTCGTMQYNQFAWCQPKSIVFNRGLEVVMFLYMPQLLNVKFEDDTIEDRDFSLDIILNHNVRTFRLNHLYFNTPSIGSNKGGIECDRYNKQIEWAKKMEKKWGPEVCEYVIKKNGVPDIKINWRYIDKAINNTLIQIKDPNNTKTTKNFIFPNPPKYKQLQFEFMKDFK